jgi:hypothetical protein
MREDGDVTTPVPPQRPEVVLVTRPAADSADASRISPAQALREVISHTIGLATFTVTTAASITQQAASVALSTGMHVSQRTLGVVVDPVLDAVVPRVADAILSRLDLTSIVLDRVQLEPIIMRALNELDLTEIVLSRVDIDAIVATADIEAIIDRVPIVPIADYVIDEIDLPQIIRQSTGGVATEAINSVRVQSFGADQWIARLTDALVRRQHRNVDAPGNPESLQGASESSDTSDSADHAEPA